MSQLPDSLQVSGICFVSYCWCEALSDVATVVIVWSVVCYVWVLGEVTVLLLERQERSCCGVRTEAEETAEYTAHNKTTQQVEALSWAKTTLRLFSE